MLCEISELYNYNISKVLKEDIPSIYDFIVKNDIDLKCYLTSNSIEEKIYETLYYRGELFLKIENQCTPEPKTFKIRIVDEDLLKETGGIVQGMSGTPIIQNNKIIGAVSHALENNPKIGYGVYIKWML